MPTTSNSVTLLTENAARSLLTLQTANPHGEEFKHDSKEALLLLTTLRIIRENLRMSTVMMQEDRANGIPVVALCALSHAAAILVRLCGCELSEQDLSTLLSNLRRFSTRWSVCRTLPRASWFVCELIELETEKYHQYIENMINER